MPGSFTDQVMARVAAEPKPSPGRAFARSLRRLAIRDALAALSSAWRLAFEPATSVPASARATAAGLLFSVVFVVGIGGSLLAGGGLALLGSDGPTSQQLAPGASLEPTPVVSVAPSPSPPPVLTPSPAPSPSPTVKPPKATPKQTDDQDRPKRETPEPNEREREDEKDERDEKDEKDERNEKDEKDEKDD